MSTIDRASTSTQPTERPTRAAVVLTLAMMVVPLLTLAVSASGCTRSMRTSSVEPQTGDSSNVGRVVAAERTSAAHALE